MTTKPENIDKIWPEQELAERLNLPVRQSGRCVPLSHWIRGGLPYAEKAERRFFFEQDVIDYLWSRRNGSEIVE
jgi:hypothetical protein